MNERAKILIVDDNPGNLASAVAVLENDAYELITVRSGPDALEQVLRQDFAVILLDIAMPGMDGFETAKLIHERERSRETPILFMTASVGDMEHIFRGYSLGAVDYMRKPVDAHALRAKVHVLARLWQQSRHIAQQAAAIEAAQRSALEASEKRFRALWDSPLMPMIVWKKGGAILDANDCFLELLGYSRTELEEHDLDWRTLLAPDLSGVEAKARAELEARGAFSVHERDFVSKHGTRVPVLFGGAYADREHETILGFALDVTERRKGEIERTRLLHELQAAIAARDDFLSVAAHELKTPLTPLRMQISMLLRQQKKGSLEPERLAQSLDKIDRAGLRMQTLVDDLLDVSRITAGRFKLDRQEADLRELASGVLARIKDVTDRAGCPVTLSAPEGIAGVWDRTRIEQVIENLVLNAAKYGAGKPIAVAVHGTPSAGIVEVIDHGMGIPAEQQARIFEKFERLAPVSHYGGFGLGLWIVRKIIEAHGGTIGVESTPGDGSRFTVQLPRTPLEELAAPPELH